MGCETIAVSRTREKEASALALGAHYFIDALDSDAIAKITALGGADVVVTTEPSSSGVHLFLPAVLARGRIVVTGFSRDPVQISSVDLIGRNLSVLGSAAGTAMNTEETLRFCALNGINPVIEQFSFDAADRAYKSMLAGTVNFRAVLNLDAESPVSTRQESQSGDRGLKEDSDMPQAPVLLARRSDPVLDCPPRSLAGDQRTDRSGRKVAFQPGHRFGILA
jgi:hypothetical protein